MKERKIMHADINHCYAQIIEMLYPELRNVPMAVGGHEEERHGIILARNLKAKVYGIRTAEALWEAKKKCPELVIVHPKYETFIYYTEKVKDIYREYSDKVESFGLDEAWVDLTDSQALFGPAEVIAKKIQIRVFEELGLTISIGLSFNKVFAKLGSDLIKPSGFVIISESNYKDVVWPLPVEDLLFVGRKTKVKLNNVGIYTVGDLANKTSGFMKDLMGKNGEMIWYFANGYDVTEVMKNSYSRPVKSVGNSITTVSDINNFEEAKHVFQVLSESVAARLREISMQGNVIAIVIRTNELEWFVRQRKIECPTNISEEMMVHVMDLLYENYWFDKPLRSIGMSVSNLSVDTGIRQQSFFVDERKRENVKNIEIAMETIRKKYGFKSIQRLSIMIDEKLTDFNPKDDHIIHPVSWK